MQGEEASGSILCKANLVKESSCKLSMESSKAVDESEMSINSMVFEI